MKFKENGLWQGSTRVSVPADTELKDQWLCLNMFNKQNEVVQSNHSSSFSIFLAEPQIYTSNLFIVLLDRVQTFLEICFFYKCECKVEQIPFTSCCPCFLACCSVWVSAVTVYDWRHSLLSWSWWKTSRLRKEQDGVGWRETCRPLDQLLTDFLVIWNFFLLYIVVAQHFLPVVPHVL